MLDEEFKKFIEGADKEYLRDQEEQEKRQRTAQSANLWLVKTKFCTPRLQSRRETLFSLKEYICLVPYPHEVAGIVAADLEGACFRYRYGLGVIQQL